MGADDADVALCCGHARGQGSSQESQIIPGQKSASEKFAGIGTDKRAWSYAFPCPFDPGIVALCRLPVTDLAPLLTVLIPDCRLPRML
jgi:hypothetical protein